jgi:DNA-directed RNA polymerase subunit alpha
MSELATVDVIGVLEKSQPVLEELFAARNAVASDLEARKRAQTFVASMPSDVAAGGEDRALALKKGLALWIVGRDAEAAAWLSRSTAKAAKVVRGHCLVACGQPAAALDVLNEVADEPYVDEAAGEAHANLGDPESVKKLVDAVAKAAGAAASDYLKGRVAELEGDREGASSLYRQAIEADDEHAPSLFRLAVHEYTFGDEDEAIELYTRCIESPRAPLNAYLNLGNVYEDRGEVSKALTCYDAVMESDPSNQRGRLFRGDALASLNMFYDEDLERRADRRSQVLRLPVTDFELSVRSRNCLAKMGVRTLGDLVQRTEQELLSYKNFGETSLQEIKDILAQKGLRLGMGREEVARDDQARTILESIGAGETDKRKLLQKPLNELELSVRSRHCMSVLGLKTVGDLVDRSEAELMTIKNFGQTSLNEVKQKLAELGLSLVAGPEIPAAIPESDE